MGSATDLPDALPTFMLSASVTELSFLITPYALTRAVQKFGDYSLRDYWFVRTLELVWLSRPVYTCLLSILPISSNFEFSLTACSYYCIALRLYILPIKSPCALTPPLYIYMYPEDVMSWVILLLYLETTSDSALVLNFVTSSSVSVALTLEQFLCRLCGLSVSRQMVIWHLFRSHTRVFTSLGCNNCQRHISFMPFRGSHEPLLPPRDRSVKLAHLLNALISLPSGRFAEGHPAPC